MIRRLLAAAAALTLPGAVAVAPLAAVPAAAATTPTHVGIVVGGRAACVGWHPGITGDEILNDVASVHYRPSDGLIDAINNVPNPPHADETHYWSYWHSDGSGGWSYSSSGASSYQPRAGTVEGWSYVNGSTSATPPPSVRYADICSDPAATTPHTTAAAAPRSRPRRVASPDLRHATTAARPAAATTPTTSAAAASSTSAGGRATARAGRTTGTTTAPTSAAVSGVATSRSGLGSLTPAADRTGPSGGGAALPTIIALALILALGAAALALQRVRGRRS